METLAFARGFRWTESEWDWQDYLNNGSKRSSLYFVGTSNMLWYTLFNYEKHCNLFKVRKRSKQKKKNIIIYIVEPRPLISHFYSFPCKLLQNRHNRVVTYSSAFIILVS